MPKTSRIATIRALITQHKQGNTSLKKFPNRSLKPSFWKPVALLTRVSPQPRVQGWLTTPTSITALLKRLCPNLSVVVISESEEKPLADEAHKLGLALHESAWVRCVLLKCADATWIYARTVVPNLTDNNPWQALKHLGNKPLGEVLFNDPQIKRSEFEFSLCAAHHWPHLHHYLATAKYSPNSPLYSHTRPQNSYARRSMFYQDNAPLLLTEVFLTPLLTHEKPT